LALQAVSLLRRVCSDFSAQTAESAPEHLHWWQGRSGRKDFPLGVTGSANVLAEPVAPGKKRAAHS
jgi:hypothetical protein